MNRKCNRLSRIVLLLLTVLLILLSACETANPSKGTETSQTGTDVSEKTEKTEITSASTEVPELTGTWSDYKITFNPEEWPTEEGQLNTTQFLNFAVSMMQSMEDRFGIAPKQFSIASADSENELPQIHLAYDASLSERAYQVVVTSDAIPDIILSAGSANGLFGAITFFCEECLPGDGSLPEACSFSSSVVYWADPCVLLYDGVYYMPQGTGSGYSVAKSTDLYTWSEQKVVFDASTCTNPAFDGIGDYWAPELHEYHGQFYIFATYRSEKTDHRGVAIFRSDTPDGEYELITDGHLQPEGWDSIDPTLYVDPDGNPWMVFVHEWTSMPDGIGDMTVVRLSDDLTETVGEFSSLFKANECRECPDNKVTDGPWIYEMPDGKLAMLWSGGGKGYTTCVAYSENGILGPWEQAEDLLFSDDTDLPQGFFGYGGGHAMLFRDQEGKLRMSLHILSTSAYSKRMPFFLHVDDSDGVLRVK